MTACDALVVGGGFYGCEVALALRQAGLERVVLVEREPALMRRASFVNQARIHGGYHYPRSLATALSSRRNFVRFCEDYAFAVTNSGGGVYAIARDSRVSPEQFEHFCRAIGAPIRPAGVRRALFDPDLIVQAYEVQEFAFDADALAAHLAGRLADAGVEVRLDAQARVLGAGPASVRAEAGGEAIEAAFVFNCTYAALDQIGVSVAAGLKRELTEMALIQPPPELADCGVTVMDGPFFSTMPFPALNCFSLSHVRYTPHRAWTGPVEGEVAPVRSNAQAMLRDSARYMPCLSKARYLRSIFDIKAVLTATEDNDGRPILFERAEESDRIISILGAKIDNIYDIRELILKEEWAR
jgi:glycine/D-amino acid oxidase-like deaminating enzyme